VPPSSTSARTPTWRAIADWEQGEIQRIRDEASTKVSARNATLERPAAANTAAGDGPMTAIEAASTRSRSS
jgi:hypothetical protein